MTRSCDESGREATSALRIAVQSPTSRLYTAVSRSLGALLGEIALAPISTQRIGPFELERGFGRLKQWRAIVTRYDKYTTTYFGGVILACTLIHHWVRE